MSKLRSRTGNHFVSEESNLATPPNYLTWLKRSTVA